MKKDNSSFLDVRIAKLIKRTGDEPLTVNGNPTEYKLIDFWRWALADVLGNTERGLLAEFIVATALKVDKKPRTNWEAFDLLTADGVKVEVKSASYVQSWEQEDYSKIQFSIRPTIGWDAVKNLYNNEPKRQADVYVFAVLSHKDHSSINPLDFDQWDFYVVSSRKLDESLGAQKSIGLRRLEEMGAEVIKYDQLETAIVDCT